MKLNKTVVKTVLFIALFIGTERFCHFATEGFRVYKIFSFLPYDPKWETSPLPQQEQEEVKKILSRPFRFLGSGGQCYAFESEDGTTVLKLFKHHHMRPESWLNRLPLFAPFDKMRDKIVAHRIKRLNHIFGSCKIAYEEFREETGVVAIHLNKTKEFEEPLTLIDKIGIAHTADPNELEFVLQKKGELTYRTIDRLTEAGDIEAAHRCLESLLDLILERSKRGIADNDPIIKRNFGYLGEKAIEIDLGSFSKNEFLKKPAAYKKNLFYESLQIKRWLAKHHPELQEHFEHQLSLRLEENS